MQCKEPVEFSGGCDSFERRGTRRGGTLGARCHPLLRQKFAEGKLSAVKFPPVVYMVKCSKFSLKFEHKFSFQISNFFNPSLTWRHDINFGQLMSKVYITY